MANASVVACNSVATEIGSNNLVLYGVFDQMQAPVFPTRVTFFGVAKVWGATANQSIVLKLVEAATNEVVSQAAEHKSTGETHTAISVFQGVTVPKSGSYEVRAYIGDQVLGAYPISVGSAKA